MTDETFETEFTKTSSKGQIVIPSKIRKKLNIVDGSLLAVTAQDDLIVLKKVSSKISSADMKTLKLIEEAWKDIDKGKYKVRSKDDFFKEFGEW
ncbi:MAG: AbrB/MazE/SpoVT family DNA-binding domain-containing protein [Candidatus Thermoplasmatota archaeon]|nr:AbrB/MazE/SpoVT family DNA-binding domain-containing protein [Candidatus Thermoplasmatota archaeon]MDA8143065.1 AbrB/MazE/SpoVT family DNA-binding domain-containing protein [Thermoplasmatales archaeon]